MNKQVQKEVKELIKKLNLNCLIKEFKNKVSWYNISCYQNLSESFIREFKDKVDWYDISRYQKLSESFIREFENKVYWYNISSYQKLSESFIREFKSKVNWDGISCCQNLSEAFIREFENKVYWYGVSYSQNLSESFIREFQGKVYWIYISRYQKLSESFIREFKNKVSWINISIYQVLSPEFRKEFKDKIDNEVYEEVNEVKTLEQKTKECKEYAKKHNLEIDDEYLYAYRNHDEYGRGVFSRVISYEKGKYYRDWHCNMRKDAENSFGLGIWPEGNTKVKIKIEDWGVAVGRDDGKARVWGFEMV